MQAAPAPVTPAAPKGSPILKIVLIVLGILLLFGLLTGGACVYMLYRTKQRITQFEKQVQKSYPTARAGQPAPEQPPTATSGPATPAASAIDLGIPVYPGAIATQGQGELSMGGGGVKVQQYTTTDSFDKVVAFYKDKLGPTAAVNQSGGSAVVQVVGAQGVTDVTVTSDSATGKTTFTISSIQK